MAVQRGAEGEGLDREGVRDALVFEGVDDRVGDAEVREGLLVEILALAGNVRGGFFDLGGCGLDVAEADDACGVFNGRGRGGGGGSAAVFGVDLQGAAGFGGVGDELDGDGSEEGVAVGGGVFGGLLGELVGEDVEGCLEGGEVCARGVDGEVVRGDDA